MKLFRKYRIKRMKCKFCKKKVKSWKGPGYIDPEIEKIVVCGPCFDKDMKNK